MWFKADTKQQLYDELESFKKENFGEYVSGKEQFIEAGWYWIEIKKLYFNSCTDYVAVAIPANNRIDEIKDQIKELTDSLVEARRITKT